MRASSYFVQMIQVYTYIHYRFVVVPTLPVRASSSYTGNISGQRDVNLSVICIEDGD